MSEAVVRAIATEAGVPPSALDPPLYEVVDPDALERLFRDTVGELSFDYGEYVVTVDSDDTITVQRRHGARGLS